MKPPPWPRIYLAVLALEVVIIALLAIRGAVYS